MVFFYKWYVNQNKIWYIKTKLGNVRCDNVILKYNVTDVTTKNYVLLSCGYNK